MSITTASICLSNYLGLPIDVVNCIARYAGTEKWIPQFDTKNNLTGKINTESVQFNELSNLYYDKPDMSTGKTIVINNSRSYKSTAIIQSKRICEDDGDIHLTLYTSIEVAYGVYNYISIVHVVSPYSTPIRQFLKGELHRPLEPLALNRQRQITSCHIENDVIFVNVNDFQVEYVWNSELNIGEYIVDIPVDELDDYAMLL